MKLYSATTVNTTTRETPTSVPEGIDINETVFGDGDIPATESGSAYRVYHFPIPMVIRQ